MNRYLFQRLITKTVFYHPSSFSLVSFQQSWNRSLTVLVSNLCFLLLSILLYSPFLQINLICFYCLLSFSMPPLLSNNDRVSKCHLGGKYKYLAIQLHHLLF